MRKPILEEPIYYYTDEELRVIHIIVFSFEETPLLLDRLWYRWHPDRGMKEDEPHLTMLGASKIENIRMIVPQVQVVRIKKFTPN